MNAIAAYELKPLPNNPREVERWALLKAARDIEIASANGDDENLRAAIMQNLALWSIIQADLTSSRSPLDEKLRANLANLSMSIDRRSFEVLANMDRSRTGLLVTINRNLAMGLAGDGTSRPGITAANADKAQPLSVLA